MKNAKHRLSGRSFYIAAGLALAVVLVPAGWWGYHHISEWIMVHNSPDTPLSNRLILPYGDAPYRLAQKIERGEAISEADVKALPDGVDQRYGDEITLLFLALGAHNLQAIDTLLAAGADPYIVDRPSQGSGRNFVYYLTMPGPSSGPVRGFDFENHMIESYLKYGGKANYQWPDEEGAWLIEEVGLIGNYKGVKILLKAGADPWAQDNNEDTLMSVLARWTPDGSLPLINFMLNEGYFDHEPLHKLKNVMLFLGGYHQRGDKTSLDIQKTALRILKRNSHYPPDRYTQDIFGGPIPWKEVENAD
ncbi:hypothetical protein [Martelella sp. AMO21009]